MNKPESFVTRIDEYRGLLEELSRSTAGPRAQELATQISGMFKADVAYANSEQRLDALEEDERDALECIREYWAKEGIDLRRSHAEWVQKAIGLLDYISYYDHHHRRS